MTDATPGARLIRVRGIVQGVGFRPFVYRLAHDHALAGWVMNTGGGVDIHIEGQDASLAAFAGALDTQAPDASRITAVETLPARPLGCVGFVIRDSDAPAAPTTALSPDLPVCDACLRELSDPRDRRAGYPYITCTACGPRYSIVLGLPYDRDRTTMREWPMCEACAREYHDPSDRRFHAQPLACPACGPAYVLVEPAGSGIPVRGAEAIARAAERLREGHILAVKGLGGYHLACDGLDAAVVGRLRARKVRKEKPFAVMVRDVETARAFVDLSPAAAALLRSPARPIVLAPARRALAEVAPGTDRLGVMLPYAPLHHLLFAAGAPEVLVMTSANVSNEPIAFEDDDARTRLAGIADGWLAGERRIARRVDDSVIRETPFGPSVLRRARGLAPGVAARLPATDPILAVGADLKAAITLVVGGDAIVGPHLGDLDDHSVRQSFDRALEDLLAMWRIAPGSVIVAHDAHPEYVSTRTACEHPARRHVVVQHHRAHVASVLAEHGALDRRVVGVAFDGTGWGDDGTIWGGDLFAGSVRDGLARVAHLVPAPLPGGDAAARAPVQAAAGFVSTLGLDVDLQAPPFRLPPRYGQALALIRQRIRVFETTSVGRLFDTVAALLGFTRTTTFEGQAAMWVEQLARASSSATTLPFPYTDGQLDFRYALDALIERRAHGADVRDLARAFHRGLSTAVVSAVASLCEAHDTETVVLSGGVFQNDLLLHDLRTGFAGTRLEVWTNRQVPCNDGGISLGQAALAASQETAPGNMHP